MADDIERLEFESLSPELQDALRPRVERLKYLGEFFKVFGHTPTVLLPFVQFTENLKDVLPKNLTEVGALTCASLMNNAYERNQHERLCEKLGFGRDWIVEVERVAPDEARLMSEDETLVQRLAISLLEYDWTAARSYLDNLIGRVGEQQGLAAMMLIGRYTVHAMAVNTLALAPPVPSIFETKTAG